MTSEEWLHVLAIAAHPDDTDISEKTF